MAQNGSTPAPRRALLVVRGVTGPVSGNTGPVRVTEPVTGRVTLPLPRLDGARNAMEPDSAASAGNGPGVPMTRLERTALATREMRAPFARLFAMLWHGKPDSMAGHRARVKSRGWVPPEMTGAWAIVIAWAGIGYHLVIARPLKAAAKAIDGSADYPLRLLMLAVFVSVLILILLHL